MTEQRPPYYACSGTTETNPAVSVASPLQQHSIDGSPSRDLLLLLPTQASKRTGAIRPMRPLEQECIHTPQRDLLLLLPILESPHSSTEVTPCLHLVHLSDGLFGLCNGKRDATCSCCGFSMCCEHTSTVLISLPDADGVWSDEASLLCTTCADLAREQIYAYHAFRISINQRA